jgi:hypothetical protein
LEPDLRKLLSDLGFYQMRNFFYYFFYRLRQANSNPAAADLGGEQPAFISIVLLLILNCLSVYFILIRLIDNDFVAWLWKEDKAFNRIVSLLVMAGIPAGVYGWYRNHQTQIEQALQAYRAESSEERRVGGALIMGYMLLSCALLILALFAPAFF